SVRAALVVALVIPLSLAASFIYLHARGMSANLLSMGAVDFGIIVDGAVILVEHVFGHVAGDDYQRQTPDQRVDSIFNAAHEVALYVTFTLPAPISLTEGRKLTPRITALMKQDVPEVTELLSQLGRPEDGTDPTLPSNLEVFVKLRPMSEWRPGIKTLDDIV